MSKSPRGPSPDKPSQLAVKLGNVVFDFISRVPTTAERISKTPADRARQIASAAAAKAALAAGSLALPSGPTALLTMLPDLLAVWKIQAQMVADIAGTYGKQTALSREQMVYCLFRHSAAQLTRDVVVRLGGRVLVKQASLQVLQQLAQKIGIRVAQKTMGKTLAKWVPLAGALGVGAYAYYDTGKVAETAIDFFSSEVEVKSSDFE